MSNFMKKTLDELEIGQDEDMLDHEKLMQDDDLGILDAFESIDRLIPEQKNPNLISFNTRLHAIAAARRSTFLT